LETSFKQGSASIGEASPQHSSVFDMPYPQINGAKTLACNLSDADYTPKLRANGFKMKRESFFGRFKKRIQEETGASPGGRYFSIVLREVFHEHPEEIWTSIFRIADPRARRAHVEFNYSEGKFADLSFFDKENRLTGLAEVKEEDQLSSHAVEQAARYITFQRQHPNARFAYITKYSPSKETEALLKSHSIQPVYYSDIYQSLKPCIRAGPTIRMLCDYLKRTTSPLFTS
jgi:hypothetical protein